MKVLVTGVNGFVGSSLCTELYRQEHSVVGVARSAGTVNNDFERVVVSAIESATDWSSLLCNVDAVIHLAARVHVISDSVEDSLMEFRKVNVDGTINLAIQAAEFGVKRFVFISSIKVNGEFTSQGKPFNEKDVENPEGAYAISKFEAEIALIELSKKTGMEVVIVRPPLVYGPGVKANFLMMMSWLNKSVPLPFGNITNKRSLVFIDNLVDLLVKVIDHPKAAGQVFLVSDDEDVSTSKLLQSLSMALGKKALLIKVPMFFLNITLRLIGKSGLSQRLLSSLQLDITKTKKLLDWTPPVRFEEGIKKTAAAYLEDLK
jgi:nucleoside-diphosphate-sugar epimerase